MSENSERLQGAPIDAYSPEDQAFFKFWYGHMKDEVMQPPLHEVSHRDARYIWNAARQQVAAPEPFLVKHYTTEEGPIIKGNGFDGLRIGDDREEAEQFVSFVNAKMQVATPAVPVGYVNTRHLSLLQEGKWLVVSMSSDPKEMLPGGGGVTPLYAAPPMAELRRRVESIGDHALLSRTEILAILDELEQS